MRYRRSTLVSLLVVGLATGGAEAQAPLDHFLCYKTRVKQTIGVTLADQFDTGTYEGKVAKLLCTPADKNGEGIFDSATHLEGYTITGPHVRQSLVTVVNQFGSFLFDTKRTATLFVPTAKSLTGSPPPPDGSEQVDHYRCVKARISKGTTPFPKGLTVVAADQFGVRELTLRKPSTLCVPTDKNGEGIKNAANHLLCYKVKPAAKIRVTGVQVNNQFGAQVLDLKTEAELCVPSLKNPPTTTSTSSTSTSSVSTSSTTSSTTSSSTTSTTTTLPPPPCGQLIFTTVAPGGTCGRINDAVGGSGTNLTPFGESGPVLVCGSLYIGGGASVQPPSPTPDGATSVYNVTACSNPAAEVLGPASSAYTGNQTQCTAPGCFFGPPLPIPNPGAPAVSTCVINRIASSPAVSGTLNVTTGAATITLPLTVSVFVTGDLNGPAPGIQACPKCVSGQCDLGPRAGLPCTTTTSAGTTHDCPPPGGSLPPFGVNLSPLVTGTATDSDAAGQMCTPQATAGCFGTGVGTCKYIQETGVAGGDLRPELPRSSTLASVFCIPSSGSPLVDTVANLPGPGATTLAGSAQLSVP
jgi:hypothetical protein